MPFPGQKEAAPGIREALFEGLLDLQRGAEVARLEGRLVQVEERLDEERIVGGEAGDTGPAAFFAVEELRARAACPEILSAASRAAAS